jgi:SAM-dependent methyltransferase
MIFDEQHWPPEGLTASFYAAAPPGAAWLAAHPDFHNLLGWERAWAQRAAELDFLAPTSPYFHLKALSTAAYRRWLAPHLAALPPGAAALDAGCGIGRFARVLADRCARVVAFDPSRGALAVCARRLAAEKRTNVELHLADLTWLDELPPATFAAALAIETLSYVADPAAALRHILRIVKPGGLVAISVEGAPGGLAMNGVLDPTELLAARRGEPVVRPGDCWVQYYDRPRFAALLADAGLTGAEIVGSHYFGEGPFWPAVDDARLADPAYVDAILAAEDACRADPVIAPWARVFAAAGRRP